MGFQGSFIHIAELESEELDKKFSEEDMEDDGELFDDDDDEIVEEEKDEKEEDEIEEDGEEEIPKLFEQKPKPYLKRTKPWSSEIGNPDSDYVIESDLLAPKIKAVRADDEKPLIVVVDDDFETLDLLKIYLQRDFRYKAFSGPREAIFFLNQNTPDLVIVDCRIHTMKALTFADIIRTGEGNEEVKFALSGTQEELESIDKAALPGYIVGLIKRPVARGDLQNVLDMVIKKQEEEFDPKRMS